MPCPFCGEAFQHCLNTTDCIRTRVLEKHDFDLNTMSGRSKGGMGMGKDADFKFAMKRRRCNRCGQKIEDDGVFRCTVCEHYHCRACMDNPEETNLCHTCVVAGEEESDDEDSSESDDESVKTVPLTREEEISVPPTPVPAPGQIIPETPESLANPTPSLPPPRPNKRALDEVVDLTQSDDEEFEDPITWDIIYAAEEEWQMVPNISDFIQHLENMAEAAARNAKRAKKIAKK